MKNKVVRFVMVTVFLLIVTGLSILVGRWQITSAGVSTAFPLGTYTTELLRGDIPAEFPPVFVFLVGRWEATFAEGGRLTISKEGQVVLPPPRGTFPGQGVYDARYAATQNQIAFHTDKGPIACDIQERDPRFPPGTPAKARSGAYNWAFDGKMLTFTKMADECGGRVVFFTAHPLAKHR